MKTVEFSTETTLPYTSLTFCSKGLQPCEERACKSEMDAHDRVGADHNSRRRPAFSLTIAETRPSIANDGEGQTPGTNSNATILSLLGVGFSHRLITCQSRPVNYL